MPTDLVSRSLSQPRSSRASQFLAALHSDDMTLLLIWTATGLAISLGFAAFAMQPHLPQDLLMFG